MPLECKSRMTLTNWTVQDLSKLIGKVGQDWSSWPPNVDIISDNLNDWGVGGWLIGDKLEVVEGTEMGAELIDNTVDIGVTDSWLGFDDDDLCVTLSKMLNLLAMISLVWSSSIPNLFWSSQQVLVFIILPPPAWLIHKSSDSISSSSSSSSLSSKSCGSKVENQDF